MKKRKIIRKKSTTTRLAVRQTGIGKDHSSNKRHYLVPNMKRSHRATHTYYVSADGGLVHNDCVQLNDDGTIDITDWSEYPDEPFTVLEGDSYKEARKDANKINKKLHRLYNHLKDLHIHEVQPVKFGGSPTDIDNKTALTPTEHYEFNKFWYMVLREVEGILNE